ncbi:MAG TPA: hypothetical protein VFK13_09930 [Gemmatimonadaceae bacterium]|nr:hypothetical protein [Gemmatimonadaceae bacterium]
MTASNLFSWAIPRFVIAAGALAAPSLSAHANPDSVELNNDCRLARQVLQAESPAPQRTHAITTIARCGVDAAPTPAHLRADPPSGRHELQVLVTSTRAVVTPELVQALLGTVQRADLSTEQRVGALLVLITYADSTVVPPFRFFIGPPDQLFRQHYGGVDHPYTAVGHDRLAVPVKDQLRPVLEQLAGGDANPEMQIAAKVALMSSPFR